MAVLRYIEVMYFAILVIVIKSTLPTIPDIVHFSATDPDFYTLKECEDYLDQQGQELMAWFKEYGFGGTIDGGCKKIKGMHKA